MNDQPSASRDPYVTLTAYAVEDGAANGASYWTRIGKVLPNRDEKGFTVLLSALPIDRKIVVRPDKPRGERKSSGNRYRQ